MDGCTYKFELYAMWVDDGGSMFTILVTYDVYNEELYILSIIVSVLIILLLMLFMKWPFYHSPCSTISYWEWLSKVFIKVGKLNLDGLYLSAFYLYSIP